MKAKLQKRGNFARIRILSTILKSLNLKINDKIIITKPKKVKMSLEERFAKYKGKNLAKDFTWDNSKGKEIW